ncbi:alcohol dehydrogenase GroES domain protein [Pluteus cervinus]|uniref:Alcohol dehydrogenase GroES domain protein n=1 Tax=Pluteus cervinus TaxID=181527 RepID=A0ACD3B4B0_9AGAR|nr:alcohol dehydrogenase GroES domain protein [Pluteus cervinus]
MIKYATKDRVDPVTGESAPVTLGHEFSGTIVETPPDVDAGKWAVGTNVVIEPIFGCMKTDNCYNCSHDLPTTCPDMNFIGIGGWGGGLSEYIAVDTRFLHVLPSHVSLEVGACIEPLAVAWYAVKRSGFKPGDSALILGAGPIGLFLLKVLRSFSTTSLVVISEPAALRRQIAVEHGATLTLDPTDSRVNAHKEIIKATGGAGTDIVFDAAGVQAGWDLGMRAVRSRGTIVNVAIWETDVQVNMNLLLSKEIFVTGTSAYDRIHSEVLEAVAAGKILGIEKLITRKIAIEDVVEKGFKTLLADKDSQVKILVRPGSLLPSVL